MRKLKRSDSVIYLGANFMPDFRIWHLQTDDVLNLFFRRDTDVRISCGSCNVFFFYSITLRAGPLKGPGQTRVQLMSLSGIVLHG